MKICCYVQLVVVIGNSKDLKLKADEEEDENVDGIS